MAKPSNATKTKILSISTKILSISEVSHYYPRQWVVFEITERNEYGLPEKGEVILNSANKRELIQKTKDLTGDLYLFYTGRIDDKVA
jgi:hypothetical protein